MQSRKQRKNDALDKRKHCFKQDKRVLFFNINIYFSTLNTYIGVLNINLRDATTLIEPSHFKTEEINSSALAT